jgi:histidine ammonia-lyase
MIDLNGGNLTMEDVEAVARNGSKVSVSPEAVKRVGHGFKVVMEAAVQNMPVYGLTVGVGWNKDQPVFKEVQGKRVLSEELLALSRQFSIATLNAHAAGIGEPMPAETVKAGMLIRLNTMLSGAAGVQPDVVRCYADFINNDIIPIVPGRGTVRQADPLLASHIGLAMAGQWEVFFQGHRMTASAALEAAEIDPIQPVGGDALSMLSTNALTAGSVVLAVRDAAQFVRQEIVVFALSLEGFNGNISPFLEPQPRHAHFLIWTFSRLATRCQSSISMFNANVKKRPLLSFMYWACSPQFFH